MVIALIAIEQIIPCPRCHTVIAIAARQTVRAIATVKGIIARPAVQHVVPGRARQPIRAIAAIQRVVAILTVPYIVPGRPADVTCSIRDVGHIIRLGHSGRIVIGEHVPPRFLGQVFFVVLVVFERHDRRCQRPRHQGHDQTHQHATTCSGLAAPVPIHPQAKLPRQRAGLRRNLRNW